MLFNSNFNSFYEILSCSRELRELVCFPSLTGRRNGKLGQIVAVEGEKVPWKMIASWMHEAGRSEHAEGFLQTRIQQHSLRGNARRAVAVSRSGTDKVIREMEELLPWLDIRTVPNPQRRVFLDSVSVAEAALVKRGHYFVPVPLSGLEEDMPAGTVLLYGFSMKAVPVDLPTCTVFIHYNRELKDVIINSSGLLTGRADAFLEDSSGQMSVSREVEKVLIQRIDSYFQWKNRRWKFREEMIGKALGISSDDYPQFDWKKFTEYCSAQWDGRERLKDYLISLGAERSPLSEEALAVFLVQFFRQNIERCLSEMQLILQSDQHSSMMKSCGKTSTAHGLAGAMNLLNWLYEKGMELPDMTEDIFAGIPSSHVRRAATALRPKNIDPADRFFQLSFAQESILLIDEQATTYRGVTEEKEIMSLPDVPFRPLYQDRIIYLGRRGLFMSTSNQQNCCMYADDDERWLIPVDLIHARKVWTEGHVYTEENILPVQSLSFAVWFVQLWAEAAGLYLSGKNLEFSPEAENRQKEAVAERAGLHKLMYQLRDWWLNQNTLQDSFREDDRSLTDWLYENRSPFAGKEIPTDRYIRMAIRYFGDVLASRYKGWNDESYRLVEEEKGLYRFMPEDGKPSEPGRLTHAEELEREYNEKTNGGTEEPF